jgi:hypothetical protein
MNSKTYLKVVVGFSFYILSTLIFVKVTPDHLLQIAHTKMPAVSSTHVSNS